MRVNVNKTKVMISGEHQKPVQKAARWPYDVCGRCVDELRRRTDSVTDFCGSPLAPMGFRVFPLKIARAQRPGVVSLAVSLGGPGRMHLTFLNVWKFV